MSIYDTYQVKKANYNGMWFKSNLEARTAEALDSLGISWQYESRVFRDRRYRGGQYTPDFYLPYLYTYIECVGRIDERHWVNAELFCKSQNAMMDEWGEAPRTSEKSPSFVFVIGDGWLKTWTPYLGAEIPDISVSRCHSCGNVFFIADSGLWSCPYCGDHAKEYSGNYNLFEFAGTRTHA